MVPPNKSVVVTNVAIPRTDVKIICVKQFKNVVFIELTFRDGHTKVDSYRNTKLDVNMTMTGQEIKPVRSTRFRFKK